MHLKSPLIFGKKNSGDSEKHMFIKQKTQNSNNNDSTSNNMIATIWHDKCTVRY